MTILDPQLEWKDLNLRMLVSKTNALATWLHSRNLCTKLHLDLDRFELSTLHLSGVCSNQLNYRSKWLIL